MSRWTASSLILILLLIAPGVAAPAHAGDWDALKARLAADGFAQAQLDRIFDRPEAVPDPEPMARKMRALAEKRLNLAKPEAERQPEPEVHEFFLDWLHVAGTYGFLATHRALLAEVRQRFGVPEYVMAGMYMVETGLGTNPGKRSAFITLASMAAARPVDVWPLLADLSLGVGDEAWFADKVKAKADWAYKELTALLREADAAGLDPLDMTGSVFGAIGLCQFMPSNVEAYGADGDGDGVVNVYNQADALFSMASYLAGHGWREDMTPEQQDAVIFTYNHAWVYVRTIRALAERLRAVDEEYGL
ncbi:MAG: lytic murein transglycosylase [Desulfovibrionaceae bacterium]